MKSRALSDAKIVDSWIKNAKPWTTAVREGQIESRRLVTDNAIIEAITECSPRTVLDIGCGEGWLCRALTSRGIDATGIDVVPALIAEARQSGAGHFEVLSYEALASGSLHWRFDVVVGNFSLLGEASVESIVRAAPQWLGVNGRLVIQTLHPVAACGTDPYRDGWRAGSWAGFDPSFTDPAPWYFRTIASWIRLFRDSGFSVADVREPLSPKTTMPASIVFILTAT